MKWKGDIESLGYDIINTKAINYENNVLFFFI